MYKEVFNIDETENETRIDVYLTDVLEKYSRTKIQNYIKSERVFVNEKPCKPSFILHTDDKVIVDFNDEDEIRVAPENIPIDIVWEDCNYCIVNKPSGMLTHPTSKEKTGTLVNALLFNYEKLSDENGLYRQGIIHRLDRNTSGLLVIAKNNDAHKKVAQMIKNREVEKRYRAIVKGVLRDNIIINEPIGRNKQNPAKMCVSKDGKESLTEVSIIEVFDDATYVDINLKTGRTHQIRVHLSNIGHPVYNDTLYGFGKMHIKTEEQVLQAYNLKFIHPYTGQVIDIKIEPDDKINKVLKYLQNR